MIGLDTNILVRYFMQDDEAQVQKVNRLMASLQVKNPGYVSLVVLIELHWVLKNIYKFDRESLVTITESILRAEEFKVESSDIAWAALKQFQASSADFTDCLIARIASMGGCELTYTFDKGAAKHAGMTLLT
jgi:predicted nucleic-acid-binding protein